MPYERTGYAPWSLTREAGVQSATVDGTIQVPQYIQPTLDTGFVDFKGNWKGRASNDTEFIGFQRDESIANGAEVLSNDTIDMVDHDFLMIALKPSNGGNYKFQLLLSGAETGDDSYFNLKPVDTTLSAFTTQRSDASTHNFDFVLDVTQSCNADVWSVFKVNDCKGFKLIQKITNNSGGPSTMEQAYMRVL
tara:strand:- start:34 stop:609 length:576 start_codon:yes stop_codon:yes gene_type:complete